MSLVKGEWLGDERIINGAGRVGPGPVELPEHLAEEFTRQGLFAVKTKVKESKDVRPDN